MNGAGSFNQKAMIDDSFWSRIRETVGRAYPTSGRR